MALRNEKNAPSIVILFVNKERKAYRLHFWFNDSMGGSNTSILDGCGDQGALRGLVTGKRKNCRLFVHIAVFEINLTYTCNH